MSESTRDAALNALGDTYLDLITIHARIRAYGNEFSGHALVLALAKLEEAGLVESSYEAFRKVYRRTPA